MLENVMLPLSGMGSSSHVIAIKIIDNWIHACSMSLPPTHVPVQSTNKDAVQAEDHVLFTVLCSYMQTLGSMGSTNDCNHCT